MNGITGLLDTALAAKLSQRLDLLGLKPVIDVAAPGPVLEVEKVGNDVRLPSHAALDRQLGTGSLPSHGLSRPPADAQLSVAARTLSAVLSHPEGDAGPVRGPVPLAPGPQPAAAPALAGALANAVAGSGLFYESHLLAFALGQRSLVQLAQEPQAHWPPLPAVRFGASAPGTPAVPRPPGEAVSAPAGPVATAAAPPGTAVAEVLHPHAVTLVHQQLDLLATGVFRWSGEAWPGVPVDWTVQQDETPQDREPGAPEEAAPRRWTTTLSLALPRLGPVEVRLTLTGSDVQAALVAAEPATLARLREAGGALARGLHDAGLRLDQLELASGAAP